MTDQEFVDQFETCRLPADQFHHRQHLRLARLYLIRYGEQHAAVRIGEAIRRYAAHLGKSDKYHETMTIAWLRLTAAAMRRFPNVSFEELLELSPDLTDKATLENYYSPELLRSDAARLQFVPPDRNPLPDPASFRRDGSG